MIDNERLRKQILLEELTEGELLRIKGLLKEVNFKKGESLFCEGYIPDSVRQDRDL